MNYGVSIRSWRIPSTYRNFECRSARVVRSGVVMDLWVWSRNGRSMFQGSDCIGQKLCNGVLGVGLRVRHLLQQAMAQNATGWTCSKTKTYLRDFEGSQGSHSFSIWSRENDDRGAGAALPIAWTCWPRALQSVERWICRWYALCIPSAFWWPRCCCAICWGNDDTYSVGIVGPGIRSARWRRINSRIYRGVGTSYRMYRADEPEAASWATTYVFTFNGDVALSGAGATRLWSASATRSRIWSFVSYALSYWCPLWPLLWSDRC